MVHKVFCWKNVHTWQEGKKYIGRVVCNVWLLPPFPAAASPPRSDRLEKRKNLNTSIWIKMGLSLKGRSR